MSNPAVLPPLNLENSNQEMNNDGLIQFHELRESQMEKFLQTHILSASLAISSNSDIISEFTTDCTSSNSFDLYHEPAAAFSAAAFSSYYSHYSHSSALRSNFYASNAKYFSPKYPKSNKKQCVNSFYDLPHVPYFPINLKEPCEKELDYLNKIKKLIENGEDIHFIPSNLSPEVYLSTYDSFSNEFSSNCFPTSFSSVMESIEDLKLLSSKDPLAPFQSNSNSSLNNTTYFSNKLSFFHYAVMKNYYHVTKYLLSLGYNPDHRTKDGYTCLHIASIKNYYNIAHLLITHRDKKHNPSSNIEARNYRGNGSLSLAAESGSFSICCLLLHAGCDKECLNHHNLGALAFASRSGYVNIVKLLLESGCEVDRRDSMGITPLKWAIIGTNLNSSASSFLSHLNCGLYISAGALDFSPGSNPNTNPISNSNSNSNLHVNSNPYEIERDFSGYFTNYPYGETSLTSYSYVDHEEIFYYLLSKSSDILLEDNTGKNILILSSILGYDQHVELIIKRLIAIEMNNEPNEEALLTTREEKIKNFLKPILNHQDKVKRTALSYAVELGFYKIVLILLEYGADPNIPDKNNKITLDYALEALKESTNNPSTLSSNITYSSSISSPLKEKAPRARARTRTSSSESIANYSYGDSLSQSSNSSFKLYPSNSIYSSLTSSLVFIIKNLLKNDVKVSLKNFIIINFNSLTLFSYYKIKIKSYYNIIWNNDYKSKKNSKKKSLTNKIYPME